MRNKAGIIGLLILSLLVMMLSAGVFILNVGSTAALSGLNSDLRSLNENLEGIRVIESSSERTLSEDIYGDEVDGQVRPESDQEAIVFQDPSFEIAIRIMFDFTMEEPIYPYMLEDVDEIVIVGLMVHTNSQDIIRGIYYDEATDNYDIEYTIDGDTYVVEPGDVQSLEDLQYFPNLTGLVIMGHDISDLSPLAAYDYLETLWLPANQIQDITPLADVTIDFLDLSFNNIDDMSQLGTSIESLYMLDMIGNHLNDISSLSAQRNLISLSLWNNDIEELPIELEAFFTDGNEEQISGNPCYEAFLEKYGIDQVSVEVDE